MKNKLLFLLLCFSVSVFAQNKIDKKNKQAEIIKEFYNNCALKYNYNYEMSEWQSCLDQGLKKDKTIARLWQEKAMPYFKARKYEVGMKFLDKAVKIDPKKLATISCFYKMYFC